MCVYSFVASILFACIKIICRPFSNFLTPVWEKFVNFLLQELVNAVKREELARWRQSQSNANLLERADEISNAKRDAVQAALLRVKELELVIFCKLGFLDGFTGAVGVLVDREFDAETAVLIEGLNEPFEKLMCAFRVLRERCRELGEDVVGELKEEIQALGEQVEEVGPRVRTFKEAQRLMEICQYLQWTAERGHFTKCLISAKSVGTIRCH